MEKHPKVLCCIKDLKDGTSFCWRRRLKGRYEQIGLAGALSKPALDLPGFISCLIADKVVAGHLTTGSTRAGRNAMDYKT